MTATGSTAGEAYLASRWRGQPGRLEVWYTTLTDPATGTGVWIHHELVAPSDGSQPYGHGWAAVFPPDQAPSFARFGPASWQDPSPGVAFAAGPVMATAKRLTGVTNEPASLSWDLDQRGGGDPLFTFPEWAWKRELLPAAHMVPAPAAWFTGMIRWGDSELALRDAPGASARIYGHGNARRWAWLHADLGGGDVCEVVAAVSTRPLLRALAPLPFLRLRVGGHDWPTGDPLLAALRLRARIDLPMWTVTGRHRDRRIRIEVTQPAEATLSVDYTNPDGSPTVCRNTERATAAITLDRRIRGAWISEGNWRLDGTAHAEVGGDL